MKTAPKTKVMMLPRRLYTCREGNERGSSSVEFMFIFILMLWMMLGFVDVVFEGYNGLLIDYGSYIGSRGYMVDEPASERWREGAETVAQGTMLPTDINVSNSGSEITLEVTNREMLRSGILYGSKRRGTIAITNSLGEQEDSFSGDNAPD